jgi:signal peptidase I
VTALAFVAALAVVLFVLDRAGLLQLNGESGTFSMAPALPPCNGRVLAEGFTYKLRDPRRGEIVFFHARGSLGSAIAPDPSSRDLQINKRVVAIPGDTITAIGGRVYVNGQKADDIETASFAPVHLGPHEYFVLGDNRGVSLDSRAFGPVPRSAIYARVILNVWPFHRLGVPRYDKASVAPGALCGR